MLYCLCVINILVLQRPIFLSVCHYYLEAITLYFLVFHRVICLLQPTANYDLAIIEDYLAGNAKIKISIKNKMASLSYSESLGNCC